MNDKEKELAEKIFDHFFKKAGISSIKIFRLNKLFVLDVCDAQDEWHTVGNFLDVMYFIVPKDYRSIMCSSSCSVKTMAFDDVLKEIKEVVITNCINGNALSIIFSRHFKTLMPAARSLEELAIMMELEA